jgi:hypothetical protein
MLLSIVFLPLLGFIFTSVFGFLIGRGSTITSTLSVMLSCCLSVKLFIYLLYTGSVFKILLAKWFHFATLDIN